MQRLFFALWPDPETRTKLAVVRNMTGLVTSNPVANTNLHMTVAFLGGVDTVRLEQVINATASVSSPRFSLVLEESGWWKHPRIFWLAPRQVPAALLELHATIARLVSDCGIAPESRAYFPHVTLARNVNMPVNLEFEPIHWDVNDICLVESIPHPGYAEYKIIQRWPLT